MEALGEQCNTHSGDSRCWANIWTELTVPSLLSQMMRDKLALRIS